jgi:hypothetical protein
MAADVTALCIRNGVDLTSPRRFTWLCVAWLSAIAATPAAAQSVGTVIVERNVNLRRDPSTAQPRIRLLLPPDELDLLDSLKTNDYYHVQSPNDEEGWVWSRNVKVVPAPPPAILASGMSPTAATAIASSWSKPAPNTTQFTSPTTGDACGPTGQGGDTETNRRKNRTDVPAQYHDVTFRAIADLPYPTAPKHRHDWLQPQLDSIAPFEGVAVRVVGYLVAIKVQTGGSGESTNCLLTHVADVDWHMALVEAPGKGEEEAVVVETTPRVRRTHPQWTKARLEPWRDSDQPVRISGWLMMDPEHRNHLGLYRSTLWEVHPVMMVEVWKDGAWVQLDILP